MRLAIASIASEEAAKVVVNRTNRPFRLGFDIVIENEWNATLVGGWLVIWTGVRGTQDIGDENEREPIANDL